MKKIVLPILISLISINLIGQNQAYVDYIDNYKGIAIKEMNEYGIPASITLAQGLLESGAGKSELATTANNHFGIKCQDTWTGATIFHDDDAKSECFRKYPAAIDSYEDHSQFLINRPRYNFLFELASNDYKAWAFGLKQAGYASSPTYPSKLIKIIEDYKLNELDVSVKPKKSSHALKTDAKDRVASKDNSEEKQNATATVKKKESFFELLFKPAQKPQVSDSSQNKVFSDGKYIADITAFRTHEVKKINDVNYVVAKEGDTYSSIADELSMFEKELLNANEVQYGTNPKAGDIVFLSKKKNKGAEDTYTFKEGDTMYLISQMKGIKERSLYRTNGLIFGDQPAVGTVIKLR